MSDHDVIVIGSGIGGLTAALTCAQQGRDVLVLEAAKQFGGFINPFSRKHFTFDTGIHYVGDLGEGQPLRKIWDRLGLTDHFPIRELNPDGFDRYIFPDYETAMCKGFDEYRDRLAKDFPKERAGLRKFFDLLKDVDAFARLTGNMGSPLPLIKFAPKIPKLLKYMKSTFSEIVDEFIDDYRLKAVLAAPGGDIGLPPGKASGIIMMAVLAHFLNGAYFPEGGTKAVRDAYISNLKEHGVTLKRNSKVEKILTRGGKVTGVRLAGGDEYSAPVVISNADVVVTIRDLLGLEKVSRRMRRKTERMNYSLGSLCAFVGTDIQPDEFGLDDSNIWHYTTYDIDGLYEPPLSGELAEEFPFYMTVPTLKDPSGTHAPAGKHTVEIFTFAAYEPFEQWKGQRSLKRDDDYMALKEDVCGRLIQTAQIYLPGLAEHAEVLEFATPLTNEHYVNTPHGSIYGPDHTPEQVGLGRFTSFGPVGGLYLCGSGVLGAGIATCTTSGYLAGKAALNYKSTAQRGLRRLLGS